MKNTSDESFTLAKIYFEHKGNLEVSSSFKTLDGYTYNRDGYKLGYELSKIRKKYEKDSLSQFDIERYSSIGMRWERTNKNDVWFSYFNLAKIYFENKGNLRIPSKFNTFDGITYDESGKKLGSWLSRQKVAYKEKTLSLDKIKLLESIGIEWELKKNNDFDTMYNALYNYYVIHKDLNIPDDYRVNGKKIKDYKIKFKNEFRGISKDKLSFDEITKLDNINFEWFSKLTNIKLMREEINEYNIKRKRIEILNRVLSSLSICDNSSVPNKDEINKILINKLDVK